MAKVLKIVLIVAVAVAVIVFAPQLGALFAGLGSGVASAAAIAAATSAIYGIGISLALSAVMMAFRKTPPGITQSLVDRLNSSVVPSAPRKIVFGRTAAGNDIRFFDTYGSKKDQYCQIVALASHRVNAILQWNAEDTVSWSNGYVTGKYASGITSFRAITEGNAGNAFSLGTGAYWNASSTFTGCAYLGITYKLDSAIFPQGIPAKTFTIVEGCPLYDPRRDSANGGSGSHRPTDQSTWEWNAGGVEIGRNPALALLTYIIGYRINGKLAWGMGVPISRINLDNFRTYANICEERVTLQGGGTEQRYTCDGTLSTSDTHETVISGITAAMGSCKLTDAGGRYTIIGGYDDTMGPKPNFDEGDLVGAANSPTPYNWSPAASIRETYNIARGRFADPNQGFQLVEWPAVETQALPDNIPRTMTLDLGFVSSPTTCQRIAKQFLLREAKCPGTFSALFGPKAFAVEVGQLMTLSLPAQGWNNKLFRVLEQAENHDLLFQMTLREEDPIIYAWDREEKPLPAVIRPTGYDPLDTVAPAGLTLTSDSFAGSNGMNVSEIKVSWTPETSTRAIAMQIQSRLSGNSAWTEESAQHDPKAGEFRFTSNAPGASVEVRARYRMDTGVFGAWMSATVVTAAVSISYTDVAGRPTSLGAISPTEGSKLGGIAPGATNGAPAGSLIAGTLAETVASNANAALGAVKDSGGNIIPVQRILNDINELRNNVGGETGAAGAYADAANLAKQAAEAARDVTLGYKNAAAGYADTVTAQAGVASNAVKRAQIEVNRLYPDRPSVASDYVWGPAAGGPEVQTPYDGTNSVVSNDPVEGAVRQLNAGSSIDFFQLNWMPVGVGQSFRITIRARSTTGTASILRRIQTYDANGALVNYAIETGALTLTTTWQDFTYEFTSADIKANGSNIIYIRVGFWNQGAANAQQYARMGVQNITLEKSVAGAVTAATNFAQTATTKAEEARQSAISATDASTNATTQAGNAFTSSQNASSSAFDALQSKNAAAASQTVSVSSAAIAKQVAAINYPVDQEGSNYTSNYGAAPSAPSTFVPTLANGRWGIDGNTSGWVSTRNAVPATPGVIYEFELEQEVTFGAAGGEADAAIGLFGLNASYSVIGESARTSIGSLFAAGRKIMTGKVRFSDGSIPGTSAWPTGSVWLRPYGMWRQSNTGNSGRTLAIRVRDVTSEVASSLNVTAASKAALAAIPRTFDPRWWMNDAIFYADVAALASYPDTTYLTATQDGYRLDGSHSIGSKFVIPVTTGQRYQVILDYKPVAGTVATTSGYGGRLFANYRDARGDYMGSQPSAIFEPSTGSQVKLEFVVPAGVALINILVTLDVDSYNPAVKAVLKSVSVDNITAATQAAASATAAVQSAQSAQQFSDAAGNSAASAQASSVLSARVAGGSFNLDPMFSDPSWNAQQAAPGWTVWAQAGNAFIGKDTSRPARYGAYAQQISRNGGNSGIYQSINNIPAGGYVMECEVELIAGTWSGAGMHINFNNGTTYNKHFGTEKDTAQIVHGGSSYNRRTFSFYITNPTQTAPTMYCMAAWDGFGSGDYLQAGQTTWHFASLRPASDSEIQAQRVIPLEAKVTSQEGAIANLNGKTLAYFEKVASVPGADAFIKATALNDQGVATSNVSIGGTSVAIYNTQDGLAKRALYLANGGATFDGLLTARVGVVVGDGQWQYQYRAKEYPVSDGQFVNFGQSIGSVPSISFGPCPLPLGTGEIYAPYPDNATSTGFTARLRILGAPTSANQSVGPGSSSNGSQEFSVGKSAPDATNGQYTMTASGTLTVDSYYEGGGYDCVHIDSWVGDDKQAGDVAAGDELLILNEDREGYEPARVQRAYLAAAHCVRIETGSGILLTLSETTPITLRDGREINVRDVLGENVAVLDNGAFRWEPVINIIEIGEQPVARISVQSATYAAGDAKGRMIFTHNANKA